MSGDVETAGSLVVGHLTSWSEQRRRMRTLAALLALLGAGAFAISAGAEGGDDEPPVVHAFIEVTGEAVPFPVATILDEEALLDVMPAGDGSEVLRDVAGVDLGRMGGHGLEPFVRGLGRDDLTVLLDGAVVSGGCPNRMDPATSFAAVETTDRVVVLPGVQTLRHGGAPGGTVLFERHVPELGGGWSGEVSTGGTSWSEVPDLAVDVAAGGRRWTLRALAAERDSGSYQDGSGREVRSAASSLSAVIIAGWRPDDRTLHEISYEHTRTDDALFAGAGMDAPEDRAHILRLESERRARKGSPGWSLRAFADSVDHLMNNYELRPLTVPMAMEVPTETTTVGFRGHLTLGERRPLLVGLLVESAAADATRYAGPTPDDLDTVQSIMWPEVTRTRAGAFVEGSATLGGRSRLVAGLRVDRFTAAAGRADETTLGGSGPTPRGLWSRYLGTVDDSWSGTGVGGLVRLEHERGPWRLHAGLSRTLRAADATERYLAANSASATQRWVGNPELDLALHRQLDVGAGWQSGEATLLMTAFADDVTGLILRDRARGQPGVALDDGATIYRNVDARRHGAEAVLLVRLAPTIRLAGDASWVWAENTTDGRPIAQTPPLHGRLTLAWVRGRLDAACTLRWAERQDRVDDDPTTGSGQDAGPTAGWGVLDLTGGVDLGHGVGVLAGVANVLDRTYANHLNRASLFDPLPVRVNEPGRTWWVRLRWTGRSKVVASRS